MNPPFSVVFLTTLIGMGQGCFLALVIEQYIESLSNQNIVVATTFFGVGGLVVLCLLFLGLIASFFHLGHPERAWRAIAKWKTSWLSREVIVLPLFMAIVFIYTLLNFFPQFNIMLNLSARSVSLSLVIGTIGVFCLILLFICTSMVYACLKFLQEWHSPFTMLNFILMGLASGFVLAMTIAMFIVPVLVHCYGYVALILTVLAFVTRVCSLLRNKKLRPKSTLQSAIGVKNSKIVQKSSGAMGHTYNSGLFRHGRKLIFLRSIKWIFLSLAFLIPSILLLIQLKYQSSIIAVLILLIQYCGLLAERWYFFAEANHPQNIYYQTIS